MPPDKDGNYPKNRHFPFGNLDSWLKTVTERLAAWEILTTPALGRKMSCKKIVIACLSGLAVAAITSCRPRWEADAVRITVAVDTNAQFVLTVENPTAHVVLFDDPRFSTFARFDWELARDREIIARSGKGDFVRDPLLPAHLSGPIDIFPNRPFICNLTNFYPDLANRALIGKATSFLWYCRVWDETATNWIQASGTVRLK